MRISILRIEDIEGLEIRYKASLDIQSRPFTLPPSSSYHRRPDSLLYVYPFLL